MIKELLKTDCHMTKTMKLYTDIGVDVSVKKLRKKVGERVYLIQLLAGKTPKIIGCLSFYTELVFDEKGSFVEQGIYEK